MFRLTVHTLNEFTPSDLIYEETPLITHNIDQNESHMGTLVRLSSDVFGITEYGFYLLRLTSTEDPQHEELGVLLIQPEGMAFLLPQCGLPECITHPLAWTWGQGTKKEAFDRLSEVEALIAQDGHIAEADGHMPAINLKFKGETFYSIYSRIYSEAMNGVGLSGADGQSIYVNALEAAQDHLDDHSIYAREMESCRNFHEQGIDKAISMAQAEWDYHVRFLEVLATPMNLPAVPEA